ncbi:LysM peptidoglycan-binding domain-containing protein [Lacibacter sp. H375]|uniref:CIS tube protein n=1 Tax=Lacibacter sp. H375 TaxID=3133424 RepID=UPI0030C3C58C
MTLKAFGNADFSDSSALPDGEFTVQVNPESYTLTHTIEYTEQQAGGTSAAQPRYSSSRPQNLEFDFLFDATGVLNGDGIPAAESGVPVVTVVHSIVDTINKLKKVVYDFVGETHETPYVKIYWGTMLFKCRLTNLSITYKLFKPDGTPIRASAKCSFIGAVEDVQRTAAENAQSPDLTHVRRVKHGDTLPFMCYTIYGDENLYLQVAAVNQLNHYRDIKVGQELFFPPVEKIKA